MSTMLIVSTLVTAVIIPFFAPMLMDLLCNSYIQLMNKKNGKPTWIVGTEFDSVILENGATIPSCYIYAVTWKNVVLRLYCDDSKNRFVRIKKRNLMKATVVERVPITK
jgi:hypothetical protein